MISQAVNFEEEPRKVPKPIPYSQNSLIHPTVPDVSLILQETSESKSPAKNSFSGTEFQTYNAWRWKNINDKEKESLSSKCVAQSKKDDFFPINDKFAGSDIERRKNEILYGNPDEPRRPLPPRPVPLVPKCIGASFSDASFNDDSKDHINAVRGAKLTGHNNIHLNQEIEKFEKPLKNGIGISNDIGDLYNIISEQNKQMVLLQKQIEHLLRAQETKEKHIEQLLKSQETKENKIEQLLKIQDMKEKHIEQLLKAQEKHEKQIQHLIQSQDQKERQRFEELKQLKETKAEVVSVGIMTTMKEVLDKSTSTYSHSENEIIRDVGDVNVGQGLTDYDRLGKKDRSLTLNSLHIPAIQEHIPTPQSSIHVEMPEYVGSSDEESDIASCLSKDIFPQKQNDAKSLGYTFYNNVLAQVNDIIRGNEDKENELTVKSKERCGLDFEKPYLQKYTCLRENHLQIVNPPTAFAEDKFKKLWGVDGNEQPMDACNFDGSPISRPGELKVGALNKVDYTPSPSDISLKMNALALKYLKQEQISQYDMEPQSQQNCRQPDVTIYNVTNLSFGTMRYLERYRISSNESGKVFNARSNHNIHSPQKFLQQKAKAAIGSCDKFKHT